jgi:hypothetical protein
LLIGGGGHGPALAYVLCGSPITLSPRAPGILFPVMWSVIAALSENRKTLGVYVMLFHYGSIPFALSIQTHGAALSDVRTFVTLSREWPLPAAAFLAVYASGQAWLWFRFALRSGLSINKATRRSG